MNKSKQSLIEINIATILLGGVGLFAKLISLPAPVIIFGRTMVAFVLLYVLTRLLSASLKIANRKQLLTMVMLGASSLLQWVFFFKAIQVSTVSLGVVIFTSYPIFICFLEPWLNKEKIKATDLLVAIAILAAVYIAAPGFSWSDDSNRGTIFAIIAGFGHAVNIVLKRKYAAGRFPSLTISFYEHFFANLLLIPILPFIVSTFDVSAFSVKNLGLIVILGICFSALTRFLVAQSLLNLSARTVGFVITLEPIYAIVFAGFLLNEVPSIYTLVGGAMIIAAILAREIFASKGAASAKPKVQEEALPIVAPCFKTVV